MRLNRSVFRVLLNRSVFRVQLCRSFLHVRLLSLPQEGLFFYKMARILIFHRIIIPGSGYISCDQRKLSSLRCSLSLSHCSTLSQTKPMSSSSSCAMPEGVDDHVSPQFSIFLVILQFCCCVSPMSFCQYKVFD